MPLFFTTQDYKTGIKCNLNTPEKGVAPSPILRCSSYWKGCRGCAIDYSHHVTFFLIFITCCDTFGEDNRIKLSTYPGTFDRQTEERKLTRYLSLSDRFRFVPRTYIDWLHVNPSWDISFLEVKESRSLYINIYIFVLFLKRIFAQSYMVSSILNLY